MSHTNPTQSADEASRLNRCSPAYRVAVTGREELPASRKRCGAVQFRALGISQKEEDGHHILRATIDEGRVVEIRLPKNVGLVLPSRAHAVPPVETHAQKRAIGLKAFRSLEADPQLSLKCLAAELGMNSYMSLRQRLIGIDEPRYRALSQSRNGKPVRQAQGKEAVSV